MENKKRKGNFKGLKRNSKKGLETNSFTKAVIAGSKIKAA